MPTVTNMPGKVDFKVYQNDSLVKTVTLTDENDDPIDLSTASVVMQVRQSAGDDVLIELTEADGITVTGAGNNVISINKVIDIDSGSYQYDIEVTYASGVVQTVIYGLFLVNPDITR